MIAVSKLYRYEQLNILTEPNSNKNIQYLFTVQNQTYKVTFYNKVLINVETMNTLKKALRHTFDSQNVIYVAV